MERLTERELNNVGTVYYCECFFKDCDGYCSSCVLQYEADMKLKEYEDLEEQLESVYGECDGLLEKAVEHLVRHEGIEIGSPFKARLLTDEDVDKWQEYKQLEEQGLLLKLPCKVGDKIYHIEDGDIYEFKTTSIEVRRENGEYIFCIAFMDYKAEDFGKIVFLTKEDAEEALRKKVE